MCSDSAGSSLHFSTVSIKDAKRITKLEIARLQAALNLLEQRELIEEELSQFLALYGFKAHRVLRNSYIEIWVYFDAKMMSYSHNFRNAVIEFIDLHRVEGIGIEWIHEEGEAFKVHFAIT